MEDIFSVATSNRFSCFMEEEDNPGDDVIPARKVVDRSEKKLDKKVEKNGKTNRTKDNKEKSSPPLGKKVVVEAGNRRRDGAQPAEKSPGKDRPAPSERPRPPRDNRRPSGGTGTSGEKSERANDNRLPRGPRPNRGRLPSRENDSAGPTGGYENDNDGRLNRGGERSRPSRGFRGGRGGPGPRGGKREFERRSGSDKSSVKPVDKREGAGAHNWGTVKDDIETNNEWAADDTEQPEMPNGEVPDEQKENSGEAPADTEKLVEKENGEEVDQVPKESEITLDEYKAIQEKKRFRPDFKERQPGENEDSTQWKNTVEYKRTDDEFFPGTREVVEKLKTSGRIKTPVESSFFFKDTSRRGRGGGGGGGRGGGDRRGGRYEGGGRGTGRGRYDDRGGGDKRGRYEERGRKSGRSRDQFDVEDEKDFPSLGTVSA